VKGGLLTFTKNASLAGRKSEGAHHAHRVPIWAEQLL